MVKEIDTATVKIWGYPVGAVSWLEDRSYGVFEYEPSFLAESLDISPIHMGLDIASKGDGIFFFPALNKDTFLGLPGLLADALPDRFGNRVIDAWLAHNGRDISSFSPIERLCYSGNRGMGALEFSPVIDRKFSKSVAVEVSGLVDLARQIMSDRLELSASLGENEDENAEALLDILRVGTSAGGARPKAVIAINDKNQVRSGQTRAPKGYDYWILKFDGVSDLELGEPKDYGRIEYAYYLMAKDAGITMTECRLLEENGRAHFLTKRFDRQDGEKVHMQSLCGLAHYDYNRAGAYSYEQAFEVMRKIRLNKAEAVQQYRRMVFNVISRNQDDHTKNISFLMGRDGKWQLSPAYDVIYSHNPAGKWTNKHQMTINGKSSKFTRADLCKVAESIGIQKPIEIIDEVIECINRWPDFASKAGVKKNRTDEIKKYHRINLPD